MDGKLVALTGPAGSGKDTLALSLTDRINQDSTAHLISGSAFFRAAALWACEQGYDPGKPLPEGAFDLVELSIQDRDAVRVKQGEGSRVYTASDYATAEVGKAGSDFARHSVEVYNAFIFRTIQVQIEQNSREGTHSVLGARDSLPIAELVHDVPTLLVYIYVSADVQRQRLSGRLERGDEQGRERYIQQELLRDQQDMASGRLPSASISYQPLARTSEIEEGVIYQLDNSLLSVDEATDILYRSFAQMEMR